MIVWLATVDEERDYGNSATRLIGVFFTAQAACSAAEEHWAAVEYKSRYDNHPLVWSTREHEGLAYHEAPARWLDEYCVYPETVR